MFSLPGESSVFSLSLACLMSPVHLFESSAFGGFCVPGESSVSGNIVSLMSPV